MIDTIANRAKEFLRQPFNSQGDVFSWLLFVGLVMSGIIFWNQILRHIKE